MRRALMVVVLTVVLWPVSAFTTASSATTTAGACSWAAFPDSDTVNALYPDTDATYWSYQYAAEPATKLIVDGTYPRARYFSFHVYSASGVALDSLYDAQIAPLSGSGNPYVNKLRPGQAEH